MSEHEIKTVVPKKNIKVLKILLKFVAMRKVLFLIR